MELHEGNLTYMAACIVYGNGQCLGVITQLRIEEFKKRQSFDYDTGV